MKFVQWSELKAHVILRSIKDVFSSYHFCKRGGMDDMPYSIELTQPFTYSKTLEQKKVNLNIAANHIRKYVIRPNEIFSFWRCVGNPNTKFTSCTSKNTQSVS